MPKMIEMKRWMTVVLAAFVPAAVLVALPLQRPARAAVITCANVDRPVPLTSRVPGAAVTGYRMDREIDTDFYEGCSGSEDSVYVLTLQLRNATQAELSDVTVECKVFNETGLLMDRLRFDVKFPAKLDPGDSARATASASSTHARGERLDCALNAAT